MQISENKALAQLAWSCIWLQRESAKKENRFLDLFLGMVPKFRNDHNRSSRYIITDDPNEFIKL